MQQKKFIIRLIFLVLGLGTFINMHASSGQNRIMLTAYNAEDSARITEIVKLLPENPKGFGEPISNREAWEEIAALRPFKHVVDNAEKYLGQPFPEWNDSLYLQFSEIGIRPDGQAMINARQNWLHPLVWAECLENKGRFIPAIETALRELTSQNSWVLPAHDRDEQNFYARKFTVDLHAATYGFEYAMTLYLLQDKLSEEIRNIVLEGLYEHMFNPVKNSLLSGQGHDHWLSGTHNWNAVCLGGTVGAALAVIEDPIERAFFVHMAEKYSVNSVVGFEDDGYCTEGLGYYNYGFSRYIQLHEILWQATSGKIDLFEDEKLKKIAAFGANIEIMNNSFPYFADCRIGTTSSPQLMYYNSRNLGLGLERFDTLDFRGPARLAEGCMRTFPNSASMAKPVQSAESGLGIRSYFDISRILISRPGPKSNCRMAAAFKGGHNDEHHNHNDVGSYTIVVDNEQMMGDNGGPFAYTDKTFSSQRYTLYKSLGSFGHPVPLVNETEQHAGRDAEAKVLKTRFTEEKDVFKIDLSSAYADVNLKTLNRTFELDRYGNGTITVTDEFKFKKKGTFETAITFSSDVEVVDNTTLIFERNGTKMKAFIDAAFPVTLSRTVIEDNAPAYTRIGIKLSGVSKGRISIVYTPL